MFLLVNHTAYFPTYFHHHISFLQCCGAFSCSGKNHTVYFLHFSTSIVAFCGAVWSFPCVFVKKKNSQGLFFFLFLIFSFFFLDEFFRFCFWYIQLLFLLFFTGGYLWILQLFPNTSNHLCFSVFSFLSIFKKFLNPLLHPFLFSFFLLSLLSFFPLSFFLHSFFFHQVS